MKIKVTGEVWFKDTKDSYTYEFDTMNEAIDYHRKSLIAMVETIADYDGGFASTIRMGGKVIQENTIDTIVSRQEHE